MGTPKVVGELLGIRAIRNESNIIWRLLISSFCSLRKFPNADFHASQSATPLPRLPGAVSNVVCEVNRPYRSSRVVVDFLNAATGAADTVENGEMDPMLDFGAIDRAIGGADRMLTVSIPKEAIMVSVVWVQCMVGAYYRISLRTVDR